MKWIVATSKVKIKGGESEFTIIFNGRTMDLYMDGTPVESGFISLEAAHMAAVDLIAELEEEGSEA